MIHLIAAMLPSAQQSMCDGDDEDDNMICYPNGRDGKDGGDAVWK